MGQKQCLSKQYLGDGVWFPFPKGRRVSLKEGFFPPDGRRFLYCSDNGVYGFAIPTSLFRPITEKIIRPTPDGTISKVQSLVFQLLPHSSEPMRDDGLARFYGPTWEVIAALEQKKGSCYYRSSALAAILRTAEIQARIVGVEDFYGEGFPHFWVEAFANGTWRAVDTFPGKVVDYFMHINGKVIQIPKEELEKLDVDEELKEKIKKSAENALPHREIFKAKKELRFECFEAEGIKFRGKSEFFKHINDLR
jgi:hypothetical protein